MSRPGLEPGPPAWEAWEASTLEKSHLDSLYAGCSEPLLMMSLLHPDLYSLIDNWIRTRINVTGKIPGYGPQHCF